MASKLWNYKNCRSSNSRPNSFLTKSSASDRASSASDRADTQTPPNMTASEIDMEELKSQIIISLKADISAVTRTELNNSLADNFYFLKSEIQAVRMEIANNAMLIRTDTEQLKATIKDMDELQAVVSTLKMELKEL